MQAEQTEPEFKSGKALPLFLLICCGQLHKASCAACDAFLVSIPYLHHGTYTLIDSEVLCCEVVALRYCMSMHMTYVLASRVLQCWLQALKITPTRMRASAIGVGARYQV